jgi:CHAT domain-containing protein
VASSLNNLATLLKYTGRYFEAEPLLRKSLTIREATLGPNHPVVATSLGNLALLLTTTGKYAEAEPLYRRALAIKIKTLGRNHSAVASTLGNLALLLQSTGRNAEAVPLLRRALGIRQLALGPNHPDTAASLHNLADSLRRTGRYDLAEMSFRKSVVAMEKALGPNHPDLATSLNNLAQLLRITGRNAAEAKSLCARALAIREKSLGPNHPNVAGSLINCAALLRDDGRNEEVEPLLHRAYQIAFPAGDIDLLHDVQGSLSDFYKITNPRLAIFYGKQAVNTLQLLRAGLAGAERETQRAYADSVASNYKELAELLINQRRLLEAEQVLTMLKEQEYFEFLLNESSKERRSTRASYTLAEATWVQRQADIISRLTALKREQNELTRIHEEFRTTEQKARLKQLEQALADGRAAVLTYLAHVQDEFNRSAGDEPVAFAARDSEDLQHMQKALGQLALDAVQIQYLMMPQRLHILLNTPTGQLHRESSIQQAELNQLITAYRAVLQNPQSDPLPQARKLYDVLIKPIEQDLEQAHAKTLMVWLDGNLRYLPMAALHNGQHWLTQDYAIALYTAAARGNLMDLPKAEWKVSGLGVSRGIEVDGQRFSPLPAVPLELSNIVRSNTEQAGILPGKRYLDDDFTAQALRDSIGSQYPVLHLATHFHFATGGTSADSFLLLGNGQKLTLSEFERDAGYRMRGIDLLTLSACETALSGVGANGREVEGLGTLAQEQGAKAVLATLWSVADASTGIFMRNLYKLRQKQQLTKAEATRQSQLAFIDGSANESDIPQQLRGATLNPANPSANGYHADPKKPFAHPYYWAPFVLMGNWL